MFELGQSAELALPTDAVSPIAAQGQLGLGGTYYASNANNNNPVAASFRQGFIRYHFNEERSAIRLAAFEFIDGQRSSQRKIPDMQWLQANRIAHRLIGNFGFSNGQRSFDGLDLKLGGRAWDITAMAGRATQGSINMNANPELNVDIQYLAYTRALAGGHILMRGFGLGYHDGRTGLTKTDNRSAAARALDHKNIRIGTYGGDFLATVPVRKIYGRFLFWGAGQDGSWGLLDHRAGAFDVEAGWRLNSVATRPWLRGGYFRSTGDRNNADGTHNTFSVLPTPRIYARFPFFNMMNSKDEFVQSSTSLSPNSICAPTFTSSSSRLPRTSGTGRRRVRQQGIRLHGPPRRRRRQLQQLVRHQRRLLNHETGFALDLLCPGLRQNRSSIHLPGASQRELRLFRTQL